MKDTEKKDLHVKAGDRVLVIAGKDKGKEGNIRKVDRSKGKVIVEGLNMVTKAQKPQPALNIQGGLVQVEAPIDSSNVQIICPNPKCQKATRVAMQVIDGKKVRVCKKCGESLDA